MLFRTASTATETARRAVSAWVAIALLTLALAGCGSPTESAVEPADSVGSVTDRVVEIVTRIVQQTVIVTRTPDVSQAAPAPANPVTLDISMSRRLPNIDPHLAADQRQLDYVENLFVGLTNRNPASGTIEPELAESWTVADDGRTWTFNLRDDVYWVRATNTLLGTTAAPNVTRVRPVVAGDVVYAIQRLCSRDVENSNTYSLFLIEGCAQVHQTTNPTETDLENIGIRAIDDTTLQIRLNKPAGQFLSLTSTTLFKPVPADIVEEFGNDWRLSNGEFSTGWQTPEFLVTSGPFVMTAAGVTDEQTVLARNPLWPLQRRGNVDIVNIWVLDDDSDAFDLWRQRTLDVSPLPSAERANMVRQFPDRVRFIQEQILFYIGFDFGNQVFREVEMRRAFSAAIDRQVLVDEIYGGSGVAVRHATTSGVSGGVEVSQVGVGYSPDFARQQLAASTYKSCLLIPPLTMQVSSADLSLRQAELIRDMWIEELKCPKENIIIEQVPFGALLSNTRRESGGARPDMWELAWAPPIPDAHSMLTDLLHCNDSENRQNRPCDESDDLMRRAATTFDQAQRSELYRQAENMLFGERGSFPIVPLYVRARGVVVQSWLDYSPAASGGEQYDTYLVDYGIKQLQRDR